MFAPNTTYHQLKNQRKKVQIQVPIYYNDHNPNVTNVSYTIRNNEDPGIRRGLTGESYNQRDYRNIDMKPDQLAHEIKQNELKYGVRQNSIAVDTPFVAMERYNDMDPKNRPQSYLNAERGYSLDYNTSYKNNNKYTIASYNPAFRVHQHDPEQLENFKRHLKQQEVLNEKSEKMYDWKTIGSNPYTSGGGGLYVNTGTYPTGGNPWTDGVRDLDLIPLEIKGQQHGVERQQQLRHQNGELLKYYDDHLGKNPEAQKVMAAQKGLDEIEEDNEEEQSVQDDIQQLDLAEAQQVKKHGAHANEPGWKKRVLAILGIGALAATGMMNEPGAAYLDLARSATSYLPRLTFDPYQTAEIRKAIENADDEAGQKFLQELNAGYENIADYFGRHGAQRSHLEHFITVPNYNVSSADDLMTQPKFTDRIGGLAKDVAQTSMNMAKGAGQLAYDIAGGAYNYLAGSDPRNIPESLKTTADTVANFVKKFRPSDDALHTNSITAWEYEQQRQQAEEKQLMQSAAADEARLKETEARLKEREKTHRRREFVRHKLASSKTVDPRIKNAVQQINEYKTDIEYQQQRANLFPRPFTKNKYDAPIEVNQPESEGRQALARAKAQLENVTNQTQKIQDLEQFRARSLEDQFRIQYHRRDKPINFTEINEVMEPIRETIDREKDVLQKMLETPNIIGGFTFIGALNFIIKPLISMVLGIAKPAAALVQAVIDKVMLSHVVVTAATAAATYGGAELTEKLRKVVKKEARKVLDNMKKQGASVIHEAPRKVVNNRRKFGAGVEKVLKSPFSRNQKYVQAIKYLMYAKKVIVKALAADGIVAPASFTAIPAITTPQQQLFAMIKKDYGYLKQLLSLNIKDQVSQGQMSNSTRSKVVQLQIWMDQQVQEEVYQVVKSHVGK